MPTVIVLDLSLSMTRPVQLADIIELTRKQLAILGLKKFLDTLSVYSKLEFISLLGFSSTYEEKCPFTRDYNLLKNELQNLNDCDKTCIEVGLHGVNQTVLGEWGSNTAVQILLVTDGSTGVGPGSLKDSLTTINQRSATNPFPLPFPFPAKLHIVCIAPPNDPSWIKVKPLYQELVDLCGCDGSVLIPENQLNEVSVCNLFQKLAEDMYTSFKGVLKCGHLESKIILSPSPIPYTKVTSFDYQVHTMSDTVDVCGFIPIADVGSPMTISRHLILPVTFNNTKENILTKTDVELTEDEGADEGKTPSFCVLLHGALKVENMAALVMIGENWFGFIYSWADCKKKSNLMLTVLMPGSDAVPWLGDLNYLHCSENFGGEHLSTFPVRPLDKRSYSQNSVVWIRQAGLQSDIQKILRHARKLPEKTQQFYKELNRLRKAAIQLGFIELLSGLAYIFDQECTQLPGTAHPDCALQLTHAAEALRKLQTRDIKHVITPLPTNYNSS